MIDTSVLAAFEDALRGRGIIVPPGGIVADGIFRRIDAEGKNGKKDAAYILFPDSPVAGGFENWKDGRGWENWLFKGNGNGKGLSAAEERQLRERWAAARKVREEEKRKNQEKAVGIARKDWAAAKPAPPDHPYLANKKVKAHNLRVHADGRLLVPMRDVTGELWNLQRIDATGEKKFLPGGRTTGLSYSIGPDPGEIVVIAEGASTAVSIFEATEIPVAAAMSAGNLLAAGCAIRDKYPKTTIIFFADNDQPDANGVNVGVVKATEAAKATGGIVAMSPTVGDDANDLYVREGAEAVKVAIDAARTAAASEPEMGETDDQKPGDAPTQSGISITKSAPLKTAQSFIKNHYQHGGARTLHYNGGLFYVWTGTHYVRVAEERIKSELYMSLSGAKIWVRKPLIFSEEESDCRGWVAHTFNPKRKDVDEVLAALKAAAYCTNAQSPKWLGEYDGAIYAEEELIAFNNGVLHVPTDTFLNHSPLFFNTNTVPFDYNPNAGDPVKWNKFLDALWDDDLESRDTLQEIMGLLLLPDTKHQKIFGIVGPKRAGKGVIARVIRGLLGLENIAAPTLASLSTNFGMSSLIGKRAAIISDARLGGRADQHTIAERLLSISGEDAIDIDRKFLTVWTGTLAVRFVILTNEVPRIADMSGALPSRLIFLELKESFYGREDMGLTAKLLNELPAIALWAIQGWKRLQGRGFFLQPSSAQEVIREMEDLSSPVGAFVRECCVMGVGKEIAKQQMFKAYQLWSRDGGKTITATDATFGRDLLSATHRTVTSRQPRGAGEGERQRVYAGITLTDAWLTRVTAQERLEELEDLRRVEKAEGGRTW